MESDIFSYVSDIKGVKDLIVDKHTEGQNSKNNEWLVHKCWTCGFEIFAN